MAKTIIFQLVFGLAFFTSLCTNNSAAEFIWPSPGNSLPGESEGPFSRLVIDGGILIDGTGAPPLGPVTIVVEKERISKIFGLPGMYTPQMGESGKIEIRTGDKLIDARGKYILPGLIDTHIRILDLSLNPNQGNTSRADRTPPEYTLKLLMAHGVTTIAAMQPLAVIDWAKDIRDRADNHLITSPNIKIWVDFPANNEKEARLKVREAAKQGADGLGEGDIEGPLNAMLAGVEEANKLGLPTYFCLHNDKIEQMNVLEWARAGLSGLPHMKGIPEALRKKQTISSYQADYNYSDEFSVLKSRRWSGIEIGDATWYDTIDELIRLEFSITPTFVTYEAFRDVQGVSHAAWLTEYLHPALEKSFSDSAVFSKWGTTEEINWKNDFYIWMKFVNDFKNRGGLVTAGSDSSYYWVLPGFGLIRNMELLQEAGFSPLEVIRTSTFDSAKWLKIQQETGSIEVGKQADLIIMDSNPLQNIKSFYGTGFYGEDIATEKKRVGGVLYTIKKGVVFDAKKILENVSLMVDEAKADQYPIAP